jgi:hypothetical protein
LGSFDDGLDALCNIVAISRPPKGLIREKIDHRKFPLLADWNRMLKGQADPGEKKSMFRFQRPKKK